MNRNIKNRTAPIALRSTCRLLAATLALTACATIPDRTAPAAPLTATPAPATAPRTLPARHPLSDAFYDRLADELTPVTTGLPACPFDVSKADAAKCSAAKAANGDWITIRDGLKSLHAPTH